MSDNIIINDQTPNTSIVVNQNPVVEKSIVINPNNAVNSVNGKVGSVILTKFDLGLDQVDNTSDLNKPLSYAVLSALSGFSSSVSNSAFYLANVAFTNLVSNSSKYLASSTTAVVSSLNNQNYDLSITNDGSLQFATNNYYPKIKTSSNSFEIDLNNAVTVIDSTGDIKKNGVSILYNNINSTYEFISDFAATNPQNIHKGYTVTLSNGVIYTFAGTDPKNPNHYLEINSNPIMPIYAEVSIYNNTNAIIDSFYTSDFKTAKYILQVENNYNNDIYYSEINVLASVQSQYATAVEYGQISTSDIILGYDAVFNVNSLELVVLFSSSSNPNDKIYIKGHRTNFYKM